MSEIWPFSRFQALNKEDRPQKVGWMDLGRRFPGVRAYAAYDIPLVFRITWLAQVVFRKTHPPIPGGIRLNDSCFNIIHQQLLLKYSALHSYLRYFTEARLSRDPLC